MKKVVLMYADGRQVFLTLGSLVPRLVMPEIAENQAVYYELGDPLPLEWDGHNWRPKPPEFKDRTFTLSKIVVDGVSEYEESK